MDIRQIYRFVCSSVVVGMLAACATSQDVDRPARIEKPDAESRLALQNAVSKALGVAYVVLADDALVRESSLVVEPARIRDFSGQRVQGRETRMPERFHLVKAGRACVLVHERTRQRTQLEHTRCDTE